MSKSIVVKLWLTMTALVFLILVTAWFAHTRIQTDRYFQQQGEELIQKGFRLSEILRDEHDNLKQEKIIQASAKVLNANIMFMDKQEFLDGCQNDDSHHDPLVASEVKSLFAGNPVFHRGPGKIYDNEVISAGVPIMSGDILKKIIMLHAPITPLSSRINDLKQVTLTVGLGGIIMATILSFFLSRRFSGPLLEMNRVAQAMAHGNYKRKVRANSQDEIGLLANSLNTLALKLEEKISALERMDNTRREFVANVSHELRTPLAIVQGYTEALLDGMVDDPEEQHLYLSHISDELNRLRRLVSELLDLKRMESGRQDFSKEVIEIDSIIDKVTKKIEPTAKENNVKMESDYDAALKPIMGNADLLEQVFFNLIINGIKFSFAGGTIKISASSGEGYTHISVSDAGSGIPQQELPFIFERFYKVDKSRTRSGQNIENSDGTGLGLAIANSIVQTHNGIINVQSRPGGGSTFTVSIPIKPA
ncbi:MAG: HAMP domain-containing protein [Firmicutes bacterium]|nr:HAMP domain-containing protein [Bacillota bacterium]